MYLIIHNIIIYLHRLENEKEPEDSFRVDSADLGVVHGHQRVDHGIQHQTDRTVMRARSIGGSISIVHSVEGEESTRLH